MNDRLNLTSDVSEIKGIGSKKAQRLEVLGIHTVGDLLDHVPVKYLDKTTVIDSGHFTDERSILTQGTLIRKRVNTRSSRKATTELVFADEGGYFEAVFFNMPYLANSVDIGKTYMLFGKMYFWRGRKQFNNPEIYEKGSKRDIRGIIPVYRCTQGITSNDLRKWVSYAIETADLTDFLSDGLRNERNMCDLQTAYRNIHFPRSEAWYKIAKYRLVYDRFLVFQIAIRRNRAFIDESSESAIPDSDISDFISGLPFELTSGQLSAIKDIEQDLVSAKPMNRLVQGDVGCGKTVVAEAAIVKTVRGGYQAAFMAPTEILARQHYNKLSAELSAYGIHTEILISDMSPKERRNILESLKSGETDLLIGTHALISDDVEFKDLGLVITDEQHRFGVNQRKALVRKGASNVLVMSATPIPRTLAATVYGDMEFSVIRSKPSNRLPVITREYNKNSRDRAYTFLRKEIEMGHQCYVVAPAIDDDSDTDLMSAENLLIEIKGKFAPYKVALLHGRMDKEEKESIMNDFLSKKIDILVSTVVIEVGIDVPNATAILIENAERFGLAQLHQLRGRVGRSDMQSYCFLVCYSESETAKERMKIMIETNDGFDISEADYRLRGAGDLMGTMQHGNVQGIVYDMYKYADLLEITGEDSERMIKDPGLIDQSRIAFLTTSFDATDNSNIL